MTKTAYLRRYRAANRDRIKVIQQRYYEKHRFERLAYQQKYAAAHPRTRLAAALAGYCAARRARKRGVLVESVSRQVVFERDAGVCMECWAQGFPGIADPANWHLDHIIPLKRNGEHSYANVQVTHPACNLKKGARVG